MESSQTLSVSSLPALFTCPSSQLETEHPYSPPSDAAELGHAVHDALASVVMGRDPDLNAIAARYGVKVGDVKPLVAFGRMAWDELRTEMPNARVEERLRCDKLRGRADVFSLGDGTLAVLDWKTNRLRSEVQPQLRGYGTCAVEQYGMPESGHVTLFTVWLRLLEYDRMTMDADDIAAFYDSFAYAKRDIGKKYAPGEACTYCRRQLVCRARHDYIQSAVVALQPMAHERMLPAELLPRLYGQAKALGNALDQYRDALRMLVRTAGPQPDGNGNTLELGEIRRTTVDARKAWPILEDEGFTEDEIAGCIHMSTGAILDVASNKAPKGMKGKAKGALRQELIDAGAVKETVHDTLKLIKGTNRG